MYIQSRYYRAPEILLARKESPTHATCKIDMWSLGCLLAELYLNRYPRPKNRPLFPGRVGGHQIQLIEECFTKDESDHRCIEIALGFNDDRDDKSAPHPFIDFLKKCLEIDPDSRHTARQALLHPWLSATPTDF